LQIFQEQNRVKLDSLLQYTKAHSARNETDLVIVRKDENSDAKYGSIPEARPLKDYLRYGFIALDKPQGPTSHEVVAWVRRILGLERAGHSGTLDPMVSGVLPIGLESATKALSALLLGPKEYIAVARIHDSVPKEILEKIISSFLGPIYQKPPQRSSVKRMTRTREIYETEIIEQQGNLLVLRILCEAGTYVRKLIYDYGEVLIVGATMAELRRTRVCQILESDIVRLHDLYEAKAEYDESGREDKIRKVIKPIEHQVQFLKQIRIRDSAVESICHGAQLAVPGIVSFTSGVKKRELVRIVSGKGELVAFAEAQMPEEEILKTDHGIAALTRRVIMEIGTYPRMWKKSQAVSETEELTEALLKKSLLDRLEEEEQRNIEE
jgi:H/ACA ribonucleoprotein complex subunit 4